MQDKGEQRKCTIFPGHRCGLQLPMLGSFLCLPQSTQYKEDAQETGEKISRVASLVANVSEEQELKIM